MCIGVIPGNLSVLSPLAMVPWAVVIAASLVAAAIDVRTRRVPNRLTGLLLLSGILWALCGLNALGLSSATRPGGIGDALLGAAVAGTPFVILWIALGAGAGDAKLMMGIGAWLGLSGGWLVLICTALAGGVLALTYALTRGRLLAALANLPRAATDLIFILNGPGRLQDRRDIIMAAVPSMPADSPAAPITGSPTPQRESPAPTTTKLRMPYGPAIFVGTCAAAAHVYWT